ncbi:MAG: hypothetical protein CMB32_07080 [Euryarchaeota archaeon]|nr:hypothetical protein [Euryarchaeota archaeon]|tara:strand:- start:780 stop:2207 length:1428 start_codon:yes stop_codon:yes gene_type:complete
MKKLFGLITSFAICTLAFSQADVQLRIIGGTYEDVATSVVPAPDGGVYALGSTSSHGDGTVRGYIAYYDSEFNYTWSALTPHGSMIENVVDGIIDNSTGDLLILTKRLGENGTYNSMVHRIVNLGTECSFTSSQEIVDSDNQSPSSLINWRGSVYVVGDSEGDCWLKNLDDENDTQSWGYNLSNETVAAARVHNDTLYVAGSTVVDGVEVASVWAWGANGNTIWANIGPDENAYGFNYSNDIATYDGGATLLFSLEREENPLGNGIIRFSDANGNPNTVVYGSATYYREGTRLIHHNGGLIKLSHTNFYGTNTDMNLVSMGFHGGYIDHDVLGTDFDEKPADMEIDDEGVIWIVGTTYGYLNGSASICIYRIASSDLIGTVEPEETDLSITNDPMLYGSVGIDDQEFAINIYPNPASTQATLSEQSDYVIYSASGVECARGFGLQLDLSSLSGGLYFVKATSANSTAVLPLQVIR